MGVYLLVFWFGFLLVEVFAVFWGCFSGLRLLADLGALDDGDFVVMVLLLCLLDCFECCFIVSFCDCCLAVDARHVCCVFVLPFMLRFYISAMRGCCVLWYLATG